MDTHNNRVSFPSHRLIFDWDEVMLLAKNNYGDFTTPDELADHIRQAIRDLVEQEIERYEEDILAVATEELKE